MPLRRRIVIAAGVVALVLVVGLGWAEWSSKRTASANEAHARAVASATAEAFAGQVRTAAEHGPLTPAGLLALGRGAHVGMVHAARTGPAVTVTFEVVQPYSAPGAVALSEVDLCYAETLTGHGGTMVDTLTPLDCARLPSVSSS